MKKINRISKKNNKYLLTLSDNTSLSFYEDTIIKYNLYKIKDIDDNTFKEIINYNNFIEGYNVALKYINTKLRMKKEIKNKLKDYKEDMVDKIIKKLEDNNYLNEELYIESYLHDAIYISLMGPIKIKNNLMKLGLSNKLIDNYLNKVDEDIWLNNIRMLVDKKIKNTHDKSKSMLKNNLYNSLLYQGYSSDLINKVLDTIEISDRENIESTYLKEYKRLSSKYKDKELIFKIKNKLYTKGYLKEDINYIIDKFNS